MQFCAVASPKKPGAQRSHSLPMVLLTQRRHTPVDISHDPGTEGSMFPLQSHWVQRKLGGWPKNPGEQESQRDPS